MNKIQEAFEKWKGNKTAWDTSLENTFKAGWLTAIAAVKEGGPMFEGVDTEWLYSVLRHADKNPDYFPDIAAGKRPIYQEEAELFNTPLYKLPEDV